MSAFSGEIGGLVPVLIAQRWVGPCLEQQPHDGRLAGPSREVKSGSALGIDGGGGCVSREEPSHHGYATGAGCGHEGCDGTGRRDEGGARSAEQCGSLHVAPSGYHHESRTLGRPDARVR